MGKMKALWVDFNPENPWENDGETIIFGFCLKILGEKLPQFMASLYNWEMRIYHWILSHVT
jgi:hypothetical protein